MFYQGAKTCVLIQKCAAQMKKQTRLRKVILNVNFNLLGRSTNLVNSSEKYLMIAQTNIVF